MKKKVYPKDQTKELSRANWELLRRNPEAMAAYEEAYSADFRAWCKKNRILEEETVAFIKDSFAVRAATNGKVALLDSWLKFLGKLSEQYPFSYSYEEIESKYREQILKDAKDILNLLIFPCPSQSLLVVVNLDRSKEAIMAEVDEIVTKELNEYLIERNNKKGRMKWLSIIDELLEVWDLYDQAGQQPWQKTFRQISKKVGRPLSTVKDQWYQAYEKIHNKPYAPESKYTTEEKRRDADQLCARCPHGAVCYKKSGEWIPCPEYVKMAGKEKYSKLVEYIDDILYDEKMKNRKKQKYSE